MKMASAAPVNKVLAGSIAGALTTLVLWVLKTYAHVDLPDGITGAITVILTFATSYLVPPGANEAVVKDEKPTP